MNREFKNFVAAKNYTQNDYISFDDYLKIDFQTQNQLPEILNDLLQYLCNWISKENAGPKSIYKKLIEKAVAN